MKTIHVMSQISRLSGHLKIALQGRAHVEDVSHIVTSRTSSKLQTQEALKDSEIVLIDPNFLADCLYSLPKLKWAQSTWAGVEPLIKALNPEKPVPSFKITRASCFGPVMAQYVLGQIINFERGFYELYRYQRENKWTQFVTDNIRQFGDLTVGILGGGTIGKEIASSLKSLGSTVIGLVRDPQQLYHSDSQFDRLETDVAAVLKDSDYICNVLPSTPETLGLLRGNALESCTKKPVFINIGRGSIIPDSDIISALSKGWISGAVLDVFNEEPLPVDSPLWHLPNVIITPHIAGPSTAREVANMMLKNFTHYINGEEIPQCLDFARGY